MARYRKPLAQQVGESDSGTQPCLFIMGSSKRDLDRQETFEELFYHAEEAASAVVCRECTDTGRSLITMQPCPSCEAGRAL